MEPSGPSDQRLTDGERKVLLFLVVCFAAGTLSLGIKRWIPSEVSVEKIPDQAAEGTVVPQSVPTDIPRETKQAPARSTRGTVSGPVDLNTATAAQLETLPGIGPAIALRIIEDRNRRGPFHSLDELGRVKGIGLKTLERLEGKVKVSSPPLRGEG